MQNAFRKQDSELLRRLGSVRFIVRSCPNHQIFHLHSSREPPRIGAFSDRSLLLLLYFSCCAQHFLVTLICRPGSAFCGRGSVWPIVGVSRLQNVWQWWCFEVRQIGRYSISGAGSRHIFWSHSNVQVSSLCKF